MTLQGDHWPFVAGAYTLMLIIGAWLAIGATLRLKQATARLRAVDPRARET
jgi:hypothetical protein